MSTSRPRRARARYAAIAAALLVVGGPPGAAYVGSNRFLRPEIYKPAPNASVLPDVAPDVAKLYQDRTGDPLKEHGIAFEDVTFETEDGSTLRGWFIASKSASSAAVVTVHGAWLDRRDFLRRVPMLHEAGYPILLFDCREHGTSAGSMQGPSFGVREATDVAFAVRFMRETKHFPRIALFGESQGGASAILAASRDPKIAAVIAENAFAKLEDLAVSLGDGPVSRAYLRTVAWAVRLRTGGWNAPAPLDVIGRISPRPVLLMHGTADDLIPVEHSERLLGAAAAPKTLWLVDGANHDALINQAPEQYKQHVMEFLQRSVPPAAEPER